MKVWSTRTDIGLIGYLAIPVGDAMWASSSSFFLFLFFLFFSRHDFVRAISLEPLLAETPNSVCCLVLRSIYKVGIANYCKR